MPGAIILSRTDKAKPEKVEESYRLLRELNEKAPIITTPIAELPGDKLLETMEHSKTLEEELLAKINGIGLGPAGLGGDTTALAVNINTYATHIAGLPVAVNICCHVNRHIVMTI